MKKRFLAWARERWFLVLIVFLYSILAFFNLGDIKAPQTFYTFSARTDFAIVLPREEEVSKILFYTGRTTSDFNLSYSLKKSGVGCNCEKCQNIAIVNPNDFNKEKEFDVSGPFRWVEIDLSDIKTSMIMMRSNCCREIQFGEFAVFDKNGEKINNIKVGIPSSGFIAEEEYINELTDESDVVPTKETPRNSSYFDEIYFTQTAYEYANGLPGYENVHPPLGKILLAAPIMLTGQMTPFTWRIMSVVAGIIIIIVVYYIAVLLFKNNLYANFAAVLTSLSGLHFVQTRVGTVDSFLCLFTVLSFYSMFKFINANGKLRYFILSGLFFGSAVSVKWSGAFGGIGLSILFIHFLKKNNLFKKKNLKKAGVWAIKGLLFFILVPSVIYCSSYLLFSKSTEAYSLSDIYTQGEHLLNYHANERTPHSAASPWFTWPIGLVPFLYYYDETTGASISLTSNYVLSYISVIALITTAYIAIKRRDKISIYILVAYLSLLLPYAFIQRPMFLYHYLPASCFAILAILNMVRIFKAPKYLVYTILLTTLISFIILYPKMAGI